MMSIEEALAQAEIISDDENWVRIEKYPYKSFYEDEEETFIDVEKREISDPSKNVSTLGENNSQLITFVMDRYADGVDLVDMLIQIQYKLQSGEEATAGPVNVYASDDKIKFGWAISNIQTQVVQTIQFIVYCTGKLADGESYLLKTKPMSYRIESTLGTGGYVEKPDEDWFLQFENVMNEKMNQVATLTDSAIESASGAKESEQNAAQSASTVQTLASEVQSNAAQAKTSEQNAKASEEAAKMHAENASAVANVQIGTSDIAGLLRGGDIHVDESGTLIPITTTDSTTLENSYAGRLLFNEIVGGMEQGENPSPDNPQPINGSVISKIRVHNGALDSSYQSKEISLLQPITLYNDVLSPQNVERKYKKVVFDGIDEGWRTTEIENGWYRHIGIVSDLISDTNKMLSNKYEWLLNYSKQSNHFYVQQGVIYTFDQMTHDDFIASLSETNLIVIGELAEPVIEELPTADKIALNSLPTYDRITHVEFVDAGVMPTVSLDYGTSKVGAKALEAYADAQIAQLAEGAEGIEELRAEIASVSDEVDAVEEQLSDKVLPQYKRFKLSSAGWYRIAKFDGDNAGQISSALSNGCDIDIKKLFSSTQTESHFIRYRANSSSFSIFLDEVSSGMAFDITKIRATSDNTLFDSYIEVYYNASSANDLILTLSNQQSIYPIKWETIAPVLTSETVNGVSVIAIHEFSQNKSYESEIEALKGEKLDKAGGTVTGNMVINTGKNTAQMLIQGLKAVGGLIAQDSNFGLFDKKTGKWLINSDAEGNVLVNGVNVNETFNKTINLFDGNFKFISFDKSSESATMAGIQEILKTVSNTLGIKQVFIHIVFTAGTTYDYWGQVINSNYAVFDEATATLTEKRRFILRNGAWTVATLAEESDVTALQTNINALNHTNISYTAATKTEALAYLDNPITIDFIGPNRSCYNFHFVDTVGDSPLGGGVTMISGYTYGDGKNGAQIALKYDGTMKVRYQKNSTWSDWKLVGDATYKDISSSIDVGDTGCTAYGYVENGNVVIRVLLPAGTTGQSLLSINNLYAPRFTINGNVGELASMTDLNKIGGYVTGTGLIYINYTESLTADARITFTYPLKTS